MQKINITFSKSNILLLNKFFRKNPDFGKGRNCEKQLVGWHDHFKERMHLATKINITFLVDIEVLNIFQLTVFFEKNRTFSKITAKNNF